MFSGKSTRQITIHYSFLSDTQKESQFQDFLYFAFMAQNGHYLIDEKRRERSCEIQAERSAVRATKTTWQILLLVE